MLIKYGLAMNIVTNQKNMRLILFTKLSLTSG